MNPRFIGKRVVILGGNSGIGLAAAKGFAAEGAKVLFTGRDPKTLKTAEAEVGHGAIALQADIADLKRSDEVMREVSERLGGIDVLFVNAGIGAFVPIEQVTEELWDSLMDINLKGVYFAVQKALPLMGTGSNIVLTSSIGALKGIPHNTAYAASKAGLRAFGRCLAAELVGRGMRVNVVSPGPVETPIINRSIGLPLDAVPAMREQMVANTPMHRMGHPDEVANTVLFLASEQASFITGIDMLVDGGVASF